MMKYIKDFQNATGETKQFAITIAVFLLIIIGGLIFALGRLTFDRSYSPDNLPPSKSVQR